MKEVVTKSAVIIFTHRRNTRTGNGNGKARAERQQ
jgi:hypothetical protein